MKTTRIEWTRQDIVDTVRFARDREGITLRRRIELYILALEHYQDSSPTRNPIEEALALQIARDLQEMLNRTRRRRMPR